MPKIKSEMYAKYKQGEITRGELETWRAQRKGFLNTSDYNNWLAQKRGFKNRADLNLARTHGLKTQEEVDRIRENLKESMSAKQRRGEITVTDYHNWLATKKGYRNCTEQRMDYYYKQGVYKPMSENKNCSAYLGIHIAERVLSKVFENITRMPPNNIGYDFICRRGYKIDVKSSCLAELKRGNKVYKAWEFQIKYNQIADYFLLIAFDTREALTPKHLWLIEGTEIIQTKRAIKKPLNNRKHLIIMDKSHQKYKDYEIPDKLIETENCCEKLKQKELR